MGLTYSKCKSSIMPIALCCVVFSTLLFIFNCQAAEKVSGLEPNVRVHAFYYPWYGNPETDGGYSNWNHPVAVRNGPGRQFPGGDDIGANFYPALGCYSSNDQKMLEQHMQQLRRGRVGTISVSWWGKGSYTDKALAGIFRAAEKHGIKINFHIEPHLKPGGRNAKMVREVIVYLIDRYGSSPALYRDAGRGNRCMFYIYDSLKKMLYIKQFFHSFFYFICLLLYLLVAGIIP